MRLHHQLQVAKKPTLIGSPGAAHCSGQRYILL